MEPITSVEKLELMEKTLKVNWVEIDNMFKHYFPRVSSIDSRSAWGTKWAENKYPLFKKFGNKTLFKKEVENVLTENDILKSYKSEILRDSNLTEGTILKAKIFLLSFTPSELRTNRVENPQTIVGHKINKGMKISRCLKFLLSGEQLDKLQIAFSRFNQSLEAKGRIEISIEPMDILSMSLNRTREWRSCHNIIDGEYSAGPISYLLDSSTVIGQVILDGKGSVPGTENIPDKIWRQMIYFDEAFEWAVFARQYPSVNKQYATQLIELLHESLGAENCYRGFLDNSDLEDFFSNKGRFHYNDITTGALSKARISNLVPVKGISSNDTMREYFADLSSQELSFIVGTSSFSDIVGDWFSSGCEAQGPFVSEDDYYDDDDGYW